LFYLTTRKISFIEVSCPADTNVPSKEKEKLYKHKPPARDFHSMYDMNVDVVPIVTGHTGVLSIQSWDFLESIPEFIIL